MLGLAPSSSYRPHGGMAPNHALHLTGALTDSEHRQVSAERWADMRIALERCNSMKGARDMKRLLPLALLIGVVASLGVSPSRAREINQSGVEAQITDIEEQFRVAKLKNDVQSLDRILDESFVGTNQNGNTRTKGEIIELFRSFPIQSLKTDSSTIRLSDNAAVVTGSQTEVNGTGTDRMLFTRVYIRSGDRWWLLASSQFRDPKLPATSR